MKKTSVSFLIGALLLGSFALAKPVPDSGASGDLRRVLTAGLRQMLSVSVPVKTSGDYIGLYNVECKFIPARPVLCTGAGKETGPSDRYDSAVGAVLVGTALRANVQEGEQAIIIKAKKVAYNLVGDECLIEGVSVE